MRMHDIDAEIWQAAACRYGDRLETALFQALQGYRRPPGYDSAHRIYRLFLSSGNGDGPRWLVWRDRAKGAG